MSCTENYRQIDEFHSNSDTSSGKLETSNGKNPRALEAFELFTVTGVYGLSARVAFGILGDRGSSLTLGH
jgi:hypothetical protein